MGSPTPHKTGLFGWPAIVLVALVAAAARLLALGHEGLWCDEGHTALTAAKPIWQLARDLALHDDAPPLFYLLVKGVTGLVGDSEAALRLLPALAGLAATLILLCRARARISAPLFWAAVFFAVAPYAIFYARQAREYGVVIPLAFGLMLSSRALLLRSARGAGPLLALCGALLCITHHIGTILVGTSALLWLLRPALGRTLRGPGLLRYLAWHLIALVPWILWMAGAAVQVTTSHVAGNFWIAEFWQQRTLLLGPLYSLGAFVPGVAPGVPLQVVFAALPPSQLLWQLLSALTILLCLLLAFGRPAGGGASGAPQRMNPSKEGDANATGREWLLEAAFVLLPLFALLLASLLWSPLYIVARTDAIAFPAFVLLIGRGLARLPRVAATLIVALWAVIAVGVLGPTYGLGSPRWAKGTDREVARFLAEARLNEGDLLVHGALTAPTLEYYLRRMDVPHTALWYPRAAGKNAAGTVRTSRDSLAAYSAEAARLREQMAALLGPDAAVWILAVLLPAEQTAPHPTLAGEYRAIDLALPSSVLVYHLVGLAAQKPLLEYRQDWVGGRRAVFRIPRSAWVPAEDLPPLRLAPASGGRE